VDGEGLMKRSSGSTSFFRGRPKRPRVVRGGSWINNPRNLRCANRNRNDPDNRNNNLGFRLVVSHDSPEKAGNAACPRADGRGLQGESARPAPGRGSPCDPGRIQNPGRLLGNSPEAAYAPISLGFFLTGLSFGRKNGDIRIHPRVNFSESCAS